MQKYIFSSTNWYLFFYIGEYTCKNGLQEFLEFVGSSAKNASNLGILQKQCQALMLRGKPLHVNVEPLRCTHQLQKEFHHPLPFLRDCSCDKLTKSDKEVPASFWRDMNDSVLGCYERRDRSREIYLKCISNLFPFPFEETKQISFVFCLSYTFELIFLVEKKKKKQIHLEHNSSSSPYPTHLAARTRKIWFSHLECISKRTHKVKFWKVNKQKAKKNCSSIHSYV